MNNRYTRGECHHRRQLADTIRIAFNQACDQEGLDVAAELARVLEQMTNRQPLDQDASRRRRELQKLLGIQQRLRDLQYPDGG